MRKLISKQKWIVYEIIENNGNRTKFRDLNRLMLYRKDSTVLSGAKGPFRPTYSRLRSRPFIDNIHDKYFNLFKFSKTYSLLIF